MAELFKWLSSNPIATTVLIVAFGTIVTSVVSIYLVAFLQGRDVSFWPPKIGPKSGIKDTSKTDRISSDLEGYWVQELTGRKDRPYSIGKLTFDKQAKEYRFDGKNYYADASLCCTWDSIHVHIDLAGRAIFYIFQASIKGQLHSLSYGFGIINLRENELGELTPVDGHFIDSLVNASPQSFTLKKLEELEKGSKVKKTDDIDAYHSALIREYHTRNE